MKTSAAVLAGGKSSRMGTNKALLKVRSCRMIDHILEELEQVSRDILIITNTPSDYKHLNVRLAADIYPNRGPLSGIHSALVNARNHYLLAVACDMPFIEASLARYLINKAEGYDVVIPVVEGYYEPLFAVYSRSCLPYIEQCLDEKKYRIIDFFPLVKVKYVNEREISRVADPERVFYNVNTPKELAAAAKLMQKD
ncbi:MAG: molybdenum cofactor guanylyltransferase [Desulfotomaculum sp.]|nr:molybdenum cofactor guanylyltransferase [Desulfotomaculum sp.]